MTTTNNAAGGQASDGGSDRRSTAGVDTTLPCNCDKVRRCEYATCLDVASVRLDSRHAYCDVHAGEHIRPILTRVLLRLAGVKNGDDVDALCEVVGTAGFQSLHPYYPSRGRLDLGDDVPSKTFRNGYVICDKCAATWVGVEYDLCAWCLDRALSHLGVKS